MKTHLVFALLSTITYALFALPPRASASEAPSPAEALTADTPGTTKSGHPFVAPAGWSLRRVGPAVILTAPEGDSRIALVDVDAADADAAVAAAWRAFDPAAPRPVRATSERPARDGWAEIRAYSYEPLQTERHLGALAKRHGTLWNVTILDLSQQVREKRDAQIELILASLFPRNHRPETLAGRKAQPLAGPRAQQLRDFVEQARRSFEVPGAAIGLVQDGRVVLAEGLGVRHLGQPEPVDAATLFMIASNTKPLTTLMLAKLVAAGRFRWDTPVTEVLPSFRLGDADTTRRVWMKHLVCACTGLPRQDFEWIFEGERMTPADVLATVATMQPTSDFGELYQYSNLLAGAAGYVGGHVVHPELELGRAYDLAMQELVFDPLGMTATTFDTHRARRGNHASPHAQELTGKIVAASWELNALGHASRPDGGAWSNVPDLLRYVQMELDRGRLPDGKVYLPEAPLAARSTPQVGRGKDLAYGIGLKIDHTAGTPMIHHGGNGFGFVSDLLWFPEHNVGAVILTNADGGGVSLRNVFRRRLLELLFDGAPEAEARVAVFRKDRDESLARERATLTVPADPMIAGQLAARYHSAELGELRIQRETSGVWFDFGGWRSEMGTRRDDDGKSWFVTLAPAASGFEFRVSQQEHRRSLVLNDGQRDYTFVAAE